MEDDIFDGGTRPTTWYLHRQVSLYHPKRRALHSGNEASEANGSSRKHITRFHDFIYTIVFFYATTRDMDAGHSFESNTFSLQRGNLCDTDC